MFEMYPGKLLVAFSEPNIPYPGNQGIASTENVTLWFGFKVMPDELVKLKLTQIMKTLTPL